MKKLFLLLAVMIFCSSTSSIADESAFDDIDTTDYTHTTQNLKYFSEKEYQQAIESYKNKFKKPKKVKQKDIKVPTSSFSNLDTNIEFQSVENIINHKGSIMIPAICETESGQQIMPGYYSIEYYQDKYNQEWLILSQGCNKIKILSEKSEASKYEATINYAYAIGKGNTIKLLYGNLDIAVEANLTVIN